jgi:hypothetical protein
MNKSNSNYVSVMKYRLSWKEGNYCSKDTMTTNHGHYLLCMNVYLIGRNQLEVEYKDGQI